MPFEKAEFLLDSFVYHLEITDAVLHLRCLKKINPLNPRPLINLNKSIPLINIVSVEHGIDMWKVDSKAKSLLQCNVKDLINSNLSSCCLLTINAYHIKNKQRRIQTLRLQTFFENDAVGWYKLLQQELKTVLETNKIQRPKTLLVFVNPFGGRQRALPVYKNIVLPLLKQACVQVTAVVTERRNHARDYVQTADLSAFDGLVAVGGDGMANEIVNGVLMAAQKQNNISLDSSVEALRSKPPTYFPSQIKLGLIPAGSTNCLSYVTQGTDDPETATLQIICGEHHPLDVCSIHDDLGKFIRFSFTMTAYGFYGQVLRKSEDLRKLGPRRYDIAGVNTFARMKMFSSEITYFLSSPDHPVQVAHDQSRCRYPCKICTKNSLLMNTTNPKDAGDEHKVLDHTATANGFLCKQATHSFPLPGELPPSPTHDLPGKQVAKGSYMMINAAMNACFCAKCPLGLSPSAHLADGTIDLMLLSCTSKADLLRYLLSHVGKANRFDFPFVQVHRVRGFRHKALLQTDFNKACYPRQSPTVDEDRHVLSSPEVLGHSCWNTDGEVIENPDITLWVHSGLICLFARGVE